MKAPVEAGRLAEMMLQAMKEKSWDTGQTADKLGITYEHTRKLTKSLAYPSRLQLEKIIKVLDLDEHKANDALTSDRIRHKYGSLPKAMTGRSERVQRLERIVQRLSTEDFDRFVLIGEALARARE